MIRTVISCLAASLIAAIVLSGVLTPKHDAPAPYYTIDSIDYKAPGPEFKITREGVHKPYRAPKPYRADEAARREATRSY